MACYQDNLDSKLSCIREIFCLSIFLFIIDIDK